jgi:two-component system, NtrC family, sensor kinase
MFDFLGRVLIIDDDPLMRELLQAWLVPAGYETVTAADGEQALNSLGQAMFDLALVDYLMPKMDGLSVLEQIADRRIHVGPLLLTASNDSGLIVEAMRRGALDWVIKPTPEESLLLVLDETMERHWARELDLPPLPDWRGQDLTRLAKTTRGPCP